MYRLVLALAVALIFAGCARSVRYQPPPPDTPETISDINQAWVQLFSDESFKGRQLTIRYPKDEPDLDHATADNGTPDFNDEADSVKWQIPPGWQFVLYKNDDFKDEKMILIGTGKVESNPGRFQLDVSSGRWERRP